TGKPRPSGEPTWLWTPAGLPEPWPPLGGVDAGWCAHFSRSQTWTTSPFWLAVSSDSPPGDRDKKLTPSGGWNVLNGAKASCLEDSVNGLPKSMSDTTTGSLLVWWNPGGVARPPVLPGGLGPPMAPPGPSEASSRSLSRISRTCMPNKLTPLEPGAGPILTPP